MARPRRLMRFARLPIRVRLTIAFAGVMAAVLGAAGVFLYEQYVSDLDAQIDAALHVQADGVEALVDAGGTGAVASSGAPLVQLYAADGRLLASTRDADGGRLLTVAEAARAAQAPIVIDRRTLASETARVRAVPAPRRQLAIAVGTSLSLRDHELSRLRTLLLIAGPLALLLASLAGHELARAALRPVDRMRARSARITERQLSERLPVPESADEIGALGTTLNAMLDRVEAAVARERRLVSDASHELRTPLTTLRAEVDLALMGDREPAELRAALESAAEEARRMSGLADDLLVLARADQGRLPLNPKPMAASDLLDAAAGRARAAADIHGWSIVVRDEVPGGATVRADPDRTAQALDNLITNALRYGEGTITLTARADGELVELHVTDEGEGFPDDLLGHAFERFGRGSEARASEPGSGLGLALAEAVAVSHGGHAQARNRPEGGADVWIALPRA
jgi:two-component system OmpR family sensor kinase